MGKINIKGPIISNSDQWIYDLFDIEATSPKMVDDKITEYDGDDLEVIINSGGGSVFDGSEIYTMLRSYSGKVTTKVVGLAASAASVIAMAGNKTLMSPTAQMMIHNVSAIGAGDYRDMEHTADILKNANKTIANSYMLKSGMGEKELLDMMDDETWLTPQQALDYKLIDEVMFENDAPNLVASVETSMLPPQVIDKIRNMKETFTPTNSDKQDKSDVFMQKKAEAKLQLLKLKGRHAK